ncbi:MAG: AraC family transcriptional regulator [Clostridiales bacterium]|nr:AraC family transcriptional regulator [Clostridiales bacterium]
MTTAILREKLNLEILNEADPNREVTGGYTGDLLSWVMSGAQSGDMWVTIMTNINIIAVASLTDVACVVIADGAEIEDSVIEQAKIRNINLYRSKKTAYQICNEPLFL